LNFSSFIIYDLLFVIYMQEERLLKKLTQKARVRRQQKRRVSPASGTTSREIKRQELAMKRRKINVKVSVRIKK